jgi:hypothetical protein
MRLRDYRLEAALPGFTVDEDAQDEKLTVTHRLCGTTAIYYAVSARADRIVADAKDHRAICPVLHRGRRPTLRVVS